MLTTAAASLALDLDIAELRAREFGRLDRQHVAYLDYTGSALYAESQLRSHQSILSADVFGNPHSENDPSRASAEWLDRARTDTLRFFDADPADYVVCFTANTSAAVKLVAESYPFDAGSTLVLSTDNHNSINGIREYAKRAGARVVYLPMDAELRLHEPLTHLARHGDGRRLFAFPAQSNFSGVKHPLRLIDDAHALGYDVLLDAAAFAPSNPLSLRRHPADFVALSFYKMFGYPTGIGALVVRRDALARLVRPWFAGGTVDFASVQHDVHRLRDSAEAFEDGTPDFLSVAAIPAGLTLLSAIGMKRIQAHVARLTALLLDGLHSVADRCGAPLVRVYGGTELCDRGGTVAFNVREPNGRVVPYALVERRAREAGVAIRGGCFCNPGAAEHALGFDAERSRECMRSAVVGGFTVEKFGACLDGAVGAVRASVGVANNADDVARLVAVVASFGS